MKYIDKKKSIKIVANNIIIGKSVKIGKNVNININGELNIGDYSKIGDDCEIKANNVTIGKHFYNSKGLRIGGGGCYNENANLTIGDKCTIHNNFINVCEPVTFGNDVGLSLDVSIITHGYWLSVLEGYPRKFAGVKINDGVIVGYRSTVLAGVEIAKNIVIGAGSVVTKNLLNEKSIYAGNPAKYIRKIEELSKEQKACYLHGIIKEFKRKYEINEININYPIVHLFKISCMFNVETFEFSGKECEITEKFRDFMRKYGIRFYSERGF